MKSVKILFRLDAASFLGLGHFYQSMALAEEFQNRGVKVLFAMKEFESNILPWVSSNGIKVFMIPPDAEEEQELNLLIQFILSNSIDCIIIDNHALGYEYTSRLRSKKILVIQIDDEGTRQFGCDLLINYNIYAPYLDYNIKPYTKCLFGPQYAILRRQFGAKVKRQNFDTKLLVTMGGGYARGEVIKVLNALKLIGNATLRKIEPQILIGPAYPSPESLVAEYSDIPVKFHLSLKNMRAIMEKTEFAICGGGGTLYELSRMGLPSIIIVLDENQKLNAYYFEKFGISKTLGWYKDVSAEGIVDAINCWIDSPELLKKHREKALQLVDGKGTIRIVDEILGLLD